MIHGGNTEAFRMFAMRAAILACSAIGVFWLMYAIDFGIHAALTDDIVAGPNPFTGYFAFDAPSMNNPATALTGINAAVFGIVITVCSIIVQLTADRYTGVAGLFLRDRTNMVVAGYYVVSCVVSLWLSAGMQPDYIPLITFVLAISLTTGGIVLMVPYFAYVFWFLEPQNLIERIRRQALEGAGKGALETEPRLSGLAQAEIIDAIEELTDITSEFDLRQGQDHRQRARSIHCATWPCEYIAREEASRTRSGSPCRSATSRLRARISSPWILNRWRDLEAFATPGSNGR
jgi:hypothetical protein